MKYILAVSGGVDSVVLLDILSKLPDTEVVVAHFDHGIRPSSRDDATFVENLAKRYGFHFEMRREELGSGASEALARDRRYVFLREVATRHNGRIMTAHHLDDVVETVAINLTRGTGWRGLAALSSTVARPLLDVPKASLVAYAHRHGLVWRDDETNATDMYLRNRIRRRTLTATLDKKRQLRALHAQQQQVRRDIETEARQIVGEGPLYNRHLFIHMGDKAAMECLWVLCGGSLTRPQLVRLLRAIKTARPGTKYEAGVGKTVKFSTRHFSL